MNEISVVIPAYNEEIHIRRCIESLKRITKHIYVLDSFSTDKTKQIAQELGATVLDVAWENSYAKKFNWGLNNIEFKTPWVMRMDSDEYLRDDLIEEINENLKNISNEITGIYIKRRVHFMGKWIKYGGYYPTYLLRIWRVNTGICEEKLMDEHIKLSHGKTVVFKYDLVDDNKQNLTVWTAKHNEYSIKEAVDILNILHKFKDINELQPRFFGTQAQRKRCLKIRYASLPLFVRPILYFHWRYFFKLGFLDGKRGFIWHFLQGLWYRFLVDAKIYQIQKIAKDEGKSLNSVIKDNFGIDIDAVR